MRPSIVRSTSGSPQTMLIEQFCCGCGAATIKIALIFEVLFAIGIFATGCVCAGSRATVDLHANATINAQTFNLRENLGCVIGPSGTMGTVIFIIFVSGFGIFGSLRWFINGFEKIYFTFSICAAVINLCLCIFAVDWMHTTSKFIGTQYIRGGINFALSSILLIFGFFECSYFLACMALICYCLRSQKFRADSTQNYTTVDQ